MTRKSELLFMDCKTFGRLYYHNVYSFYGEPIIFTALNTYGQKFFCYYLGSDMDNELWLITPISEKRTNELEQKDLPIVKAISATKNDNVLLIKVDFELGELNESWKKFSTLDYAMPDNDVFISENLNFDGQRKHSHKIRIAKDNNSKIMASSLGDVTGAFTDFIKNLLSGYKIPSNFYPKDALEGSFVYRVKTDNPEKLRDEGYSIFNKFDDIQKFSDLLDEKTIDLRVLKRLFDIQLEKGLTIQLIDEDSTDVVFVLTPETILKYLAVLDKKLANYLNSSMVPQADKLSEIKKYLEILHAKGTVTDVDFGKDDRQVSYYRDACKLLSFIHDYNKLTPFGLKAIHMEDEARFVQLVRSQFENTECCYIWMAVQNAESVLEIDEASAVDFITDNCRGLSEKTSKRRASTLSSWVKQFKAFA